MLSRIIEEALEEALAADPTSACPPRLLAAMRHAVLGGGGRLRPRLCLEVAVACENDDPLLSRAAATAVELLHCASLVHDDLPCFDDAKHRRGRPTVHRAFGEPTAVLVGDALIVLAFDVVARVPTDHVDRQLKLTRILAEAVGHVRGLVAGQAWEQEPTAPLGIYHRAKTGALFVAAAVAGATAAGTDPEPFRAMAEHLGEAYQVADDLADALADPDALGKDVRRDAELRRPNSLDRLGHAGALERLSWLEWQAVHAVPPVPGRRRLQGLVRESVGRLSGAAGGLSAVAS